MNGPLGRFAARPRVLALALAGAIGWAGPAVAQGAGPIACGTFYTVVQGDTLSRIAERAYPGEGWRFQAIYEANRSAIPSAARIEIGDRLLIPCLDGTGFQTREAALAGLAPGGATTAGAGAGAQPTATSPAAVGAVARILVLAEAAPYSGRRLPEGGMVTELVSRAMLRAPSAVGYEVVFEDARGAPEDAVTAGAFDLGFPVTRPDCARAATLAPAQRRLCEGFVYSQPLIEIENRLFVAPGSEIAAASDPGQLFGLRICRPAGSFTGDLTDEELVEPNIRLVRAAGLAGCFDALLAGRADVVVASGPDLDARLAQVGSAARASEIALMRRTRTIHAVAPKGNARGQAFLATLDRGLAELRASGEWSEVVANHLAQQAGTF
ncbi:MAG: transporter substrate-binding domain-containing protein [Thermohalobaculum sp.]|nr:transporter substrate-binding domain-containing protein [Thermohalobaculum sp.]